MSEAPTLANAELAIMRLLWETEALTAREIRESLYGNEKKAQHGTVQRLLQRLEEKGFVKRDKKLSVHLFYATMDQDEYAGNQFTSMAEKLTEGSFAPFITHLVEKKKISREEIEKIRSILNESEQEEGER